MSELISINQAAAIGVERVRKSNWANPLDHIKVDIIDGRPGPWLHLFSPANESVNGRDPVDMLFLQFDLNAVEWEPYREPLKKVGR